jgi:hypothetical protein
MLHPPGIDPFTFATPDTPDLGCLVERSSTR